jgi:hypothetical protein
MVRVKAEANAKSSERIKNIKALNKWVQLKPVMKISGLVNLMLLTITSLLYLAWEFKTTLV